MAHPLDAERPTAGSPPRPSGGPARRPIPGRPPAPDPRPANGARPRPTPRPRASAEVLDEPNIVAEVPRLGPTIVDLPADGRDRRPRRGRALRGRARRRGPDVWGMVRRAQEGDAEAFGELYDHYVTRSTGTPTTASATGPRPRTSPARPSSARSAGSTRCPSRAATSGAWLVTIARNIIRDQVKSSRYRLEVTTADMRDADRATDGPGGRGRRAPDQRAAARVRAAARQRAAGVHRAALPARAVGVRDGRDHGQEGRAPSRRCSTARSAVWRGFLPDGLPMTTGTNDRWGRNRIPLSRSLDRVQRGAPITGRPARTRGPEAGHERARPLGDARGRWSSRACTAGAAPRRRARPGLAGHDPRPAGRDGRRPLRRARAASSPWSRCLARTEDAAPARWRSRLTAGLAGAALAVTALATLVAVVDRRPAGRRRSTALKRGTEQTQLALAGDAPRADPARTSPAPALHELEELTGSGVSALPAAGAAGRTGPWCWPPTSTRSWCSTTLATMDAQTTEGAAWLTDRAVDTRRRRRAGRPRRAGARSSPPAWPSCATALPDSTVDELDGSLACWPRSTTAHRRPADVLGCASGVPIEATDAARPGARPLPARATAELRRWPAASDPGTRPRPARARSPIRRAAAVADAGCAERWREHRRPAAEDGGAGEGPDVPGGEVPGGGRRRACRRPCRRCRCRASTVPSRDCRQLDRRGRRPAPPRLDARRSRSVSPPLVVGNCTD